MAEAEPVIRAVLPDANVPTSIRQHRRGGAPRLGLRAATPSSTTGWRRTPRASRASSATRRFRATERVGSLTPVLAKGLEFDLVVLVDPQEFGDGIEGAVDRYVAMTRATQRLVVLTSG